MGYSQSNAILDLYVNILVRPTRISLRHAINIVVGGFVCFGGRII
jgi:hypothetical protein